ncbi:hypothetical protein ACEWY4_007072 [Coilia grayii]|uniref:Ig-like domain-containing protein n=1 Tax=Coilia grayii TaxID=363190 RepID=A0ABD1KFI5_9TELE
MITSNSADITTMEGFSVILSCNYTSATILQWYRQYAGSAPTFLMTVYSAEEDQRYEEDVRISGALNEEKTQVFLKISSTQSPDCWRLECEVEEVISLLVFAPQLSVRMLLFAVLLSASLIVFEGTNSVVRADPENLRLNATVKSNQVSLVISSATILDSAVYYCALQPTVKGNYNNPVQKPRSRHQMSLNVQKKDVVTPAGLFVHEYSKLNTTKLKTNSPDWWRLECEVEEVISLLVFAPQLSVRMLLFAVLLSASLIEESSEQKITSVRTEQKALEGETVTIACKYDGSVQSLQWYHQFSGSRPEYVLSVFEATNSVALADPQNLRLNATVKSNQVSLVISSATILDSAVYYCALQPTVTGTTTTLYKNPGADTRCHCLVPDICSIEL